MLVSSEDGIFLSVLVVNYNGKEYLGGCLDSIQHWLTVPYEIIVVDNASSDGSQEYLKQNYPNVLLISSHENLRFAAGNNLAAHHATGKLILLLNTDTLLCGDLAPMFSILRDDPKVGVLGCKMQGKDGEYRYSAGYFPNPGRLFSLASLYYRNGPFRNGNFSTSDRLVYEVDWVEGSFLLTPRELWENIGGLDESYYMYVEDVDYCKRVKNLGFKVAYFPNLSYIHYGGYSANRMGMLISGFRKYHKKYSSLWVRFLAQIALTLGLILKVLVFFLIFIAGGKSYKVKYQSSLQALTESPW
jgi:GT2 family glycosyltransferase